MKTSKKICLLGGSGFVGRSLVRQLANEGHHITVLSRRPERARGLLINPQVQIHKADIHQLAILQKQFQGMDVVINLVGILNEFRHQSFREVHVRLPGLVMRACIQAKVSRLLHMSALGADSGTGKSRYLRTKGEAEHWLHVNARDRVQITRFRPSVIFGRDDQFFNRFAKLIKLMPGVFPLACADAVLSPVFVENVARAFVCALDQPQTYGKRYDLCGPNEYTLRALVQYTCQQIGSRCQIMPLPDRLALLQAVFLSWVPGKPFSLDNYYSLQTVSRCTQNGLAQLGIEATALETIVPFYLKKQAKLL